MRLIARSVSVILVVPAKAEVTVRCY